MTQKEEFIAWLNDAYSTELAMIPVLENHAKDALDYPQVHDRLMRHLEETRRQSERLETMIISLGGSVSTFKSITGKTLGLGKSVSTGIFRDEMIKNFISDYAAEHLEIASYKSLIATARHLGEEQCVPVLEEILSEEEAMAAWLGEHIPMATVESLKIAASDGGKKNSKKSKSAKSSTAGKLFKSSNLVTALGVAAIGTGAGMLLHLSRNKNEGNGESNHNLKSADKANGNSLESNNDIKQSDVVVTETLIIVEEPESQTTDVLGGKTFDEM